MQGSVEVDRKVCSGRERGGRYFHMRGAIGIPGEEAELRRGWGLGGIGRRECFLSVSLCTIETQLQYSLHVYAYTYTHAHTHTHTQNFQPQLLHKIKTSSSRSTLWTSWNLRPQARKNTGTYPVIPVCVCLSAHHEVYCIALHFHRNFFSQYFNKFFDPRYIVYILWLQESRWTKSQT